MVITITTNYWLVLTAYQSHRLILKLTVYNFYRSQLINLSSWMYTYDLTMNAAILHLYQLRRLYLYQCCGSEMIYFGYGSVSGSYFSVGFGSISGSVSGSGSYMIFLYNILNINFTFVFLSCKCVRLHIMTRCKFFRKKNCYKKESTFLNWVFYWEIVTFYQFFSRVVFISNSFRIPELPGSG